MKVLLTTIVAAASLFTTFVLRAEVIPSAGELDQRIRFVEYQESQVFHLNARVGYNTHIKFAPGEVFEKWYSGDSKAFLLVDHKNYVSFKPVVEEAETNLFIITNRRAYNFLVHTDKQATEYFGVHFQYPLEEARLAEEAAAKEQLLRSIDPDLQVERNVAYIGAGSDAIRPTQVFDNGTHTFFYFPERIDIPSIFRVRPGTGERLTQATTIGNWRIVPRVSERWILRLGTEDVLCVKNLAFTVDVPDNHNNTASPSTMRVAAGEAAL